MRNTIWSGMRDAPMGRAVLAGFLGTLAMTLLMYAAIGLGLTRVDLADMLAKILTAGHPPPVYQNNWWAGMAMHFFNGAVIFPLIYVLLLRNVLPGAPWLRGVLWAIALYVLFEVAFLPFVGWGLLGIRSSDPAGAIVVPAVLHLVYGAILGYVTDWRVAADLINWQGPSQPVGQA